MSEDQTVTLKPLTEQAEQQLERNGIDWTVKKFHPKVKLFNGPGLWMQSNKTGKGMWLQCGIGDEPEERFDRIALTIDDPEYKQIL